MRRLLFVTALALGASVAQADNGLFYLGVGVTGNHVKSIGVQGFDNYFPDINSTSWQVFAGIRPIRLFAVEADYLDLGSQARTFQTPISCADTGSCATVWDSDAKAFAGYAVGFLPIPLPLPGGRAYRRTSPSSEGGLNTRASIKRAPASSRSRSFWI